MISEISHSQFAINTRGKSVYLAYHKIPNISPVLILVLFKELSRTNYFLVNLTKKAQDTGFNNNFSTVINNSKFNCLQAYHLYLDVYPNLDCVILLAYIQGGLVFRRISCICNRPFSKMAAGNSNELKLKTYTST